ncbi:MAG TPA: TIGR01777 family oxidoreductase [Streptosporangiaceae bacterium]|jgi:hypothetical protein
MRIAVAGSSGLVGGALTASLGRDGHQVLRLVRRAPRSASEISWDPVAPAGGLDPRALSGLDGVVFLAGAPIDGGRWTAARKAALRSSRVQATEGLVAAMTAAADPPPVLLGGSAVGWYGDTGDRAVDETAPPGTGFLPELARAWEDAAAGASQAGVRVTTMRLGVVLGSSGGLLKHLVPLFRLGLGARLGSGQQYVSWIALTDAVRAMGYLLDQPGLPGPVNLTAPEPVSNAELTSAMAAALHRPARLRVAAPLIRTALGELSDELLTGQRVLPARLQQAGFEFRYPFISQALPAELGS